VPAFGVVVVDYLLVVCFGFGVVAEAALRFGDSPIDIRILGVGDEG